MKRKHKEITIKSGETKIFFALVLLAMSILLWLTPYLDGEFFLQVSSIVGKSTYIIGLIFFGLSLRLFGYVNWLSRYKNILIFFAIWIWSLPFLQFFLPEKLEDSFEEKNLGGGLIGFEIHKLLYNWFDRIGEFIILIILAIIFISLLTGLSIKDFVDFIVNVSEKFITFLKNIFHKEKSVEKNEQSDLEMNEKIDKNSELEFVEDRKFKIENIAPSSEIQENKNSLSLNKNDEEGEVNSLLFPEWNYPPLSLLDPIPPHQDIGNTYQEQGRIIEKTLKSFNINSQVVNINYGPTVVQYSLRISMGTKVNKISNLSKDIALALAAPSGCVRVQAPIPGTSFVGIEVPHEKPMLVSLRELMSVQDVKENKYTLPLLYGKSVTGENVVRDLSKMPHLLIAGATGSGKSVTINAFIMGLIMTLTPDELRLILVDPKTVEFAPYADIPHLMVPVITEVDKVLSMLTWAVEEMQNRYRKLKNSGVRNIKEYNKSMGYTALPYIVIIIDEMADLMLTTGAEVESKIVRLAQMARAVGIHLVLATQRPSVNVITGLIKANIPARVAMTVATSIDSRVILDMVGAEALLGNGDMLFKAPDVSHPVRIQGVYCSNQEIERVVDFLKKQGEPLYDDEVLTANTGIGVTANDTLSAKDVLGDAIFLDAIRVIVSAQKGSASHIQRKLRIGYNRAARYIDQMEQLGIVGAQDGSKPREVLISNADEFIESLKNDRTKQI